MKKVKLLSLFLALLMLCGTVTLFASCGGDQDGILELSKDTVEVDVTEYAIVYGDSQNGKAYTSTFRAQVDGFAQTLTEFTGKKFSASKMSSARTGAGDKELLIGLTEREESQKALAEIDETGFIVQVTETKIVIVGTDNLFTLMGLSYFTEKYLSGEKSKTLTLHETMLANEVGTIVVADSANNSKDAVQQSYSFVYQEGLGARPDPYSTLTNINTYTDYPQEVIAQICKKTAQATGVQEKLYTGMVRTDKETTDKELLVGLVNREESKAALSKIDMDEYIIATTDQKIVLNAWNESSMAVGAKAYYDVISEGTKEVDGRKVVEIPKHFQMIGTNEVAWAMDFPKPEGENISLYNSMAANDNALQYLYTGSGVNKAAYDAYCKKLLSAGFKLYMENEIEGSVFKTYTNTSKGIMLYVAFNAYAHKNEFGDYEWTMSKKIDAKGGFSNVYSEFNPCIRIVSAPLDTAHMIPQELLKRQSYEKVTDSKVSTMPIYTGGVGLSYVVTLEDGSFIVFDGGAIGDNGVEDEVLWTLLSSLHTEIYGTSPTTTNPVRIAAWVLTHGHGDHYVAFQRMAKKYGQAGQMKIDYMIANIPGMDSVYPWQSIAAAMTPDHITSMQNAVKGGFQYIKVHTGQKLHLANAEIEVITTWEDLNPITSDNSNNTNTVLRFTLSNKDKTSAKVTQLWTGDANRWQSRFMCATYGDYLQSDMVNVAHHGNAGCEVEFYDLVSPEAIWWPHNANAAQNYITPANKTKGWQYEVDQHFYNDISSVKYVFTSGEKRETGITKLDDIFYTTLVLTTDGPDYDNIYDVVRKMSGKDPTIPWQSYSKDTIGACTKK